MKPIYTSILALGTVFGATAATAQGMSFSDIDTDNNDMLSQTELQAAFGDSAMAALERYDTDNDGMIGMTETMGMAEDADPADVTADLDITENFDEEQELGSEPAASPEDMDTMGPISGDDAANVDDM